MSFRKPVTFPRKWPFCLVFALLHYVGNMQKKCWGSYISPPPWNMDVKESHLVFRISWEGKLGDEKHHLVLRIATLSNRSRWNEWTPDTTNHVFTNTLTRTAPLVGSLGEKKTPKDLKHSKEWNLKSFILKWLLLHCWFLGQNIYRIAKGWSKILDFPVNGRLSWL